MQESTMETMQLMRNVSNHRGRDELLAIDPRASRILEIMTKHYQIGRHHVRILK